MRDYFNTDLLHLELNNARDSINTAGDYINITAKVKSVYRGVNIDTATIEDLTKETWNLRVEYLLSELWKKKPRTRPQGIWWIHSPIHLDPSLPGPYSVGVAVDLRSNSSGLPIVSYKPISICFRSRVHQIYTHRRGGGGGRGSLESTTPRGSL